MDNIINLKTDPPDHLMTYAIGVLNGLGIEYSISQESPLYKTMKEHRRERYIKLAEAGEVGDTLPMDLGYDIGIKGGDKESIKVSMTPVWTIQS